MNTVDKSSQDDVFFSSIKSAVDLDFQNQINQLSKLNIPINPKEIRERCEKKFFANIEKELSKTAELNKQFLALIREDNLPLFDKIIETFSKISRSEEELNEKIRSFKKLADFESLNPDTLSQEEIKEIHQLGNKWFESGDYDKSLLYFTFLSAVDSKNQEVWLAKGMSEQNIQRYEEALASYSVVLNLDPSVLMTYLLVMECLLSVSKISEAEQIGSVIFRL